MDIDTIHTRVLSAFDVCLCVCVCVCVIVCVCVCVIVCDCVCLCVYTHTHTHTHSYLFRNLYYFLYLHFTQSLFLSLLTHHTRTQVHIGNRVIEPAKADLFEE